MDKHFNIITKMNRRSFLGSQLAMASTIGFSGAAAALAPQINRTIENLPNWETGTADQFSQLIGKPFTAFSEDGTMFHLSLIDVTASNSGAARPKTLARSEGLSLLFKCDFSAELAKQGHQTVSIWNSTLGEFQLFLGAVSRKSGVYDIEAVLN